MPEYRIGPINISPSIMELLALVREQVSDDLMHIPTASLSKMKLSHRQDMAIYLQAHLGENVCIIVDAQRHPRDITMISIVDDITDTHVIMCHTHDDSGPTTSGVIFAEGDRAWPLPLDVTHMIPIIRDIANAMYIRLY